MKRLGLVLSVCLALQTSAVFAPFEHLHADAAHATGHHDGRTIHRHAAPHAATVDHHHDAADAGQGIEAEHTSSFSASTEPLPSDVGGQDVRLPASGGPLSTPERGVELVDPPGPLTPPHDDVGRRPSRPPDLSTSSLRGPPR